MEKEIKLHLCGNYVNDDLRSAVNSCVLCDYIVDGVRELIKKLNKEDLDLFYVYEEFKNTIEKGNEVSFSKLTDWRDNKVSAYQDCLRLVVKLDNMAAETGKFAQGEIIEEFNDEIQKFSLLLETLAEVTKDSVKFGKLQIKEEYIDNLLSQLKIVDEGQFLSDLGTMQFEFMPLDTNKYRNKFVEKKIKKMLDISKRTSDILWNDFQKLHDGVRDSYDKLYKIAHASLSDGEKIDEARKVWKMVSPHRQVLDNLENKLTEANEIKRQLAIHEKKLIQNLEEQQEVFDKMIEENPFDAEGVRRDADGLKFVTEEYLQKIKSVIKSINDIELEITDRYKILDRVENALKETIPTENEMKRYSALAFKFEDLYVRLELAKAQLKKHDEAFVVAIDTAIMGLGALVNLSLDGKDVFMRNNLLSGIFNCVNGIYDIVDNKNKSVELSQIKFVTTRLVKYSSLNATLNKDMQMFRRVCNNAIRDIAMMMGKPFSIDTMGEIVKAIDLAIEQVKELVETLNRNHVEQTKVLGDILNI